MKTRKNTGKKLPLRGSILEDDSVTKSLLRDRGTIGIAGTNLHDAVSTITACNARSHHLMSLGFRMLEGIEALDVPSDDDMISDEDALHFEPREEFEARAYDDSDDGDDAYCANDELSGPDVEQLTIGTFRAQGEFASIRRGRKVARMPSVLHIPGGLFRRLSRRHERFTVSDITTGTKPRPTTEHEARVQFRDKLERAGMSHSKATTIAAAAKVGSLGATLLESITKNGSIAALDVNPEPAPHRVRRIRAGVVLRDTRSANA